MRERERERERDKEVKHKGKTKIDLEIGWKGLKTESIVTRWWNLKEPNFSQKLPKKVDTANFHKS